MLFGTVGRFPCVNTVRRCVTMRAGIQGQTGRRVLGCVRWGPDRFVRREQILCTDLGHSDCNEPWPFGAFHAFTIVLERRHASKSSLCWFGFRSGVFEANFEVETFGTILDDSWVNLFKPEQPLLNSLVDDQHSNNFVGHRIKTFKHRTKIARKFLVFPNSICCHLHCVSRKNRCVQIGERWIARHSKIPPNCPRCPSLLPGAGFLYGAHKFSNSGRRATICQIYSFWVEQKIFELSVSVSTYRVLFP